MKSIRNFVFIVTMAVFVHAQVLAMAPSPGGETSVKNQGPTDRMVGGRCSYRTYEGTAVIVDIRELVSVPDSFEVKFRFQPHEPVQEPFADPTGKVFDLQTPDFRSPNRGYLEKHDLHSGAEVPCLMDVIQFGACTPVMFRLP